MKTSPVTPCQEIVRSTVLLFDSDEKIKLTEQALSSLFSCFPNNQDISTVLFKAATLNALYSTNIYDLTTLAKHITSVEIDTYLNADDIRAVESIQTLTINGRTRSIYSFATKYCCWHKPEVYPIFDSLVADMLLIYNRVDKFSVFNANDLSNYLVFLRVLNDFKEFYGLTMFSFRELDKFLWWKRREAKMEALKAL